jgi:23S rRNA pseudouridine2605 synthase
VQGRVTDETIKRLLEGVELEDGMMKFEKIIDSGGQGSNHWYHVILKEGKNREVRRLWQSQDVRVSRLIRVRYGNIILPRDLKQGRKVELSLDDIKALFDHVKLDWPEEHDEMAKERSDKAKHLSIKNQLYGNRSKTKSARASKARAGQAASGSLRKDAKTVQLKTTKSKKPGKN